MEKVILSWNDVKERYLEFHRMDKFTENMAIDVDFGYWLVNNCIIPDVMVSVCSCSKGKGIDHDENGKAYCIDCGKFIEQTEP